nr:Lrp/AsnC ligand binding domain-containing protein [Rhizobium sp. ARZ01]
MIVAILGIHANGHGRLNEIAKKMSELPFVTSVSIVTGRYDLLCEVMFEGDMEELYRVTSELLGQELRCSFSCWVSWQRTVGHLPWRNHRIKL